MCQCRFFILVYGICLWVVSCGQDPSQKAIGKLAVLQQPNQVRYFENNRGQVDSQYDYLARAAGYKVYLRSNKMLFDVTGPGKAVDDIPVPPRSYWFEIELMDSCPVAKSVPGTKLEGVSNYLLGSDPKGWVVDVSHYSDVKYENVYPRIDLVYYLSGSVLEHDFWVAPQADISQIKLLFKGNEDLVVTAIGDLKVKLGDDVVQSFSKPVSYQLTASGERELRDCWFLRFDSHKVGFKCADYDKNRVLVIDPTATKVWATMIGGSSDDVAIAVAVDSSGNSYVAGYTKSSVAAGFPYLSGLGSPYNNLQGTFDAFVTKITGTANTWTTYLGGDGNELANSIQVDSQGNVYVSGYTTSPGTSINFPTTSGVIQTSNAGSAGTYDAFVTKLVPAGTTTTYSTYIGGTGFDRGSQIALDYLSTVSSVACTSTCSSSANCTPCVVLVGTTTSSSIGSISSTGVVQTTKTGGSDGTADAFVAHISPTGVATGSLLTYIGGTARDLGTGVAISTLVGSLGNIYVLGETQSASGTPTSFVGNGLAVQPSWAGPSSGDKDQVFVAKLPSGLVSYTYFTFIGGNGRDRSAGIALDTSTCIGLSCGTVDCTGPALACATIVGTTNSTGLTMTNPFQSTLNGSGFGPNTDAYIAKLAPGADSYIYQTYFGGSGNEQVLGFQSIAVDLLGDAWFTGKTDSTSGFPSTTNGFQTTFTGAASNAFVARIANPNTAASLNFVSFLGGTTASATDFGVAIALDPLGQNATMVGGASSINFPAAGGFDLTPNGALDGFVAKIGLPVNFVALGTGSTGATNATNFAVTVPTGVSDGDQLLMALNIASNTSTPTTPSGWTSVTSKTNSGPPNGAIYLYKRTASSEPLNYTVTVSSLTRLMGAILAFRHVSGLETSFPTNFAITATTTQTASTITPTANNDMVCSFFGINALGNFSTAVGAIELLDFAPTGSQMGLAVDCFLRYETTATTAMTVTSTVSTTGQCITVGLKAT